MDNRETLTPSSGDAILKRHLFSEVARNWIKGRGHIERAYFVRRPSRQSFGFRVAASSGPIPKAPGSAGGYLLVLNTPVFDMERQRIVDLAAKNRLPTVYTIRSYVDGGGLMSYGPNVADLNRRAASYVDKILKGAKPADLPVEQPTKFELFINLKTAKVLGVTVPNTLLAQADDVIE